MLVFLDFEASSLGKASYPIEVAWVFEDGRAAAQLIRPAPEWTDWAGDAEAIHGISRARLMADGVPHAVVAAQMLEALAGHRLFASAPSWDGKWLSTLLRAAGLPRHALRLNDTDAALGETGAHILKAILPAAEIEAAVARLVESARETLAGEAVAHRALADAEHERRLWLEVRRAAVAMVARASK